MRISSITALADFLLEPPIDGLTGEETQFLLEKLGMEEQTLRQLVMSSDYNKLMLLVTEKKVLMDGIILRNYKFDEVLDMLGFNKEESSFTPKATLYLNYVGYGSKEFNQTVMSFARVDKKFQHLFITK